MKLSRSERHECYKKALELFHQKKAFYICDALLMVSGFRMTEILSEFPEFNRQRPKGATTRPWWKLCPEAWKIRVKILNTCIVASDPRTKIGNDLERNE